jgi:hypothetical protein
MMTTSEIEVVDFVVTSLIDSRLWLVGDETCLFDLGVVKLKIACKTITLEMFKL